LVVLKFERNACNPENFGAGEGLEVWLDEEAGVEFDRGAAGRGSLGGNTEPWVKLPPVGRARRAPLGCGAGEEEPAAEADDVIVLGIAPLGGRAGD
jgi:hypothetical protein